MDQTLTQDATGTMAYMQFEAMGVKKCKKQNYLLAISIIIHYKTGFMNADDHAYLQSVASKVWVFYFFQKSQEMEFSHQVHLERFRQTNKKH